jgi:hypothetical protein
VNDKDQESHNTSNSQTAECAGDQAPDQYIPSQKQRKRSFNPLLLLAAIAVVLILISSSIYYVIRQNSNTPPPITHTQTATSTVTPTANTFMNEQPLFSDNFINNSNNWGTHAASGYGASINNSRLTMKETNHRVFQESVPAIAPADFAVTTTLTITQGDQNDSAGLQVRSNQDNSQGYITEIYGNNTFDIVRMSPDPNDSTEIKFTPLTGQEYVPSLHPVGQPNTLAVIMKGPTMVVLMNNVVVKTLTDTSFNNGSLSLYLGNGETSRAAVVAFNDIAIYPAPTNLPH